MRGWFLVLVMIALLLLGSIAWSQDDATDDIQTLRQMIEDQQQKLNELTERLAALEAQQAKTTESSAKSSWAQRIKLGGDFRYRHEFIDEEDEMDRNRERIRARLSLEAKVNSAVQFDFGLATGGSYNPRSANQTLTESFTKKPVWIDYASITWTPPGAHGAAMTAGRMNNPLFIPGDEALIWDSCLNLEGIAINYLPIHGANRIFFNAGSFWIEERSKDVDSMLYAAQLGLKHTSKDGNSKLTVGAGLFDYSHTKGFPTFYDSDKGYGNTVDNEDGDKIYVYDYTLSEYFLEYSTMVGGRRLQIYGDYVRNTEVDTDDTGWLAGFTYGKLKDPGSWAFRYNYRRLEKDAVIGAFTDSIFIGGGTNGKGHLFGFDYQISKNVSTSLTYMQDTDGLTDGTDYNRGQLDLDFEF